MEAKLTIHSTYSHASLVAVDISEVKAAAFEEDPTWTFNFVSLFAISTTAKSRNSQSRNNKYVKSVKDLDLQMAKLTLVPTALGEV